MKVSYNWLRELIDFPWDPKELAEKLTLAGLEVGSVTPQYPNLDGVVVGRIESVERHPQDEHLFYCQVNIGRERLAIVSGAPNTVSGVKVPVAPPDTVLPDGTLVQKKTIRGVESFGMVCSERELGLSDDHSGLMILDGDSEIGQPLARTLNLTDVILDIDLTPNRGDALSHIGVARDIAGLTGNRIRRPKIEFKEIEKPAAAAVEITLDDPVGCPRYSARVLARIKVGRSPWWLRQRVEACGMRAINNVVDVTNYVMLERGHPLHAFDYDLFSRKKVVVRRAKPKEKFTTLDGFERELNEKVLLITDDKIPVAIAGIMGGEKSEVAEKTTNILLESAYFDPVVIRVGRKSLGLQTDASNRFERGTDPNGLLYAVNRAAGLLARLAGAEVCAGVVDVYPKIIEPVMLTLRPSRVNKILGTEIPSPEMVTILTNLELGVTAGKELQVTVPTFRPDVTREIDLIEEVARIWGYEKIPRSHSARGDAYVPTHAEDELTSAIKNFLCAQGYNEVVTNTLVDPGWLEKLGLPASPVRLQNPIAEALSVLRTGLVSSLLEVVRRNRNRQADLIKLFEVGRIFLSSREKLPREKLVLGIVATGIRQRQSWDAAEAPVDLFDLKGVLDSLAQRFRLNGFALEPKAVPFLDPESSFRLLLNGAEVGSLGAVGSEAQEFFDLSDAVYYAECDFGALLAAGVSRPTYEPLDRYPFVERDIAVVVDRTCLAGDLLAAIRQTGGELVREARLFDLYQGQPLPLDKRNLAFRLRYQSRERTLTDREVDAIQERIVAALKKQFDAALRTY